MSALRQKMIEDMQLRGWLLGHRVLYAGSAAIGKALPQATRPDRRGGTAPIFSLLEERQTSLGSTFTIALCGIKFFYEHTLKQTWHTLQFVRPDRKKKLPVVLSLEEVARVLDVYTRALPRLPEDHLYQWLAFAGRGAFAGQRYRRRAQDAPSVREKEARIAMCHCPVWLWKCCGNIGASIVTRYGCFLLAQAGGLEHGTADA